MAKSVLNSYCVFSNKEFLSFLLIGLFLMFFNPSIYAQSSNIDSIDWMIDSTGELSSEQQKEHLDRALIIARRAQLINKEARIIYQMSDWELDQANYSQALIYLDSFEHLIALYDLIDLKCLQYLMRGSVSMQLKEFGQAKLFAEEAFRCFQSQSDTLGMGKACNNMGTAEMLLEDYPAALSNFEKAYTIFSKYKLGDELSGTLGNMGYVYLNKQNPKKALVIFEKRLAVVQKNKNKISEAKAYGNLAYSYFLLKDYSKAFSFYEKSIDLAKKEGFNDVLETTYKDLAETYETKGDTKNALKNYQLYHDTHLKNLGADTQKKVSELKVKYETELKDQKISKQTQAIQTLKQEKVIRQQRLWLLLTSLASLLTIFLFFYWRQKTKLNQIEKERIIEDKLKFQALAFKEQEKAFLEKQLDYKNKDITTLALDIIRKNDFSEKLKTDLSELEVILPNKFQAKIRDIIVFTQSHLTINEELAKLQVNIEEINQAFYEKLDVVAKLSPSEKQICGLIRLNLSNKEIALIRNTTTESAKVFRYRIRKKLGLNREENIVDFLKSL